MADDGSLILVCGAINTDLVAQVDRSPEAGETVTGKGFNIFGGGKGANQAVAVARSGGNAVMLGGLGQDDFGSARRLDLEQDSVDTAWVADIEDAPSGVALILVEPDGENRIAYIPAATLRVEPEHCLRALEAVRPTSLLATNELAPDCLRVLFKRATERNCRIVFNAAPFDQHVAELAPEVDVIVLNRGEAQALARQSEADDETLIQEIGRFGVENVVITLGGDGAIALIDRNVYSVPGFSVDVVDSTGAGDAFCGAFAARISAGSDPLDAIRYANAAGALAATRDGAQSSIPTAADVRALLETK